MSGDPGQLIAIVGMAVRFPGAPDVDAFWRLLIDGRDAIRAIPADRWDGTAQLDPEVTVQAEGGFIDGVDQFDAAFFGISPREAEDVDPQQRLMLEATWRTLEDAGRRPSSLAGSRTGVYFGATYHDYEILRTDRGAAPTQFTSMGNAMDVIAGRVSYFLKVIGPSMVVATGCSSALVAVHLAGQALLRGEIDGALVGGVQLLLTPDTSVNLAHFGGLSPDARCKAFAASANGFVRGEGAAALYLKRLDRALADGDRVHGVIVRTVVNNDGGGDSLATPNPAGQEDLLRQAYAGIPLNRVAYIEAHGTGTSRGDPIEAGAIGRVIGQHRDPACGALGIGSVKTNIGHLEPAAGMAGLVKAVLSLKHGVVAPSLHAEELNPGIPFDDLGLRVVRRPLPLPADEPLYLGVNSFGWGGTNAHAVLTGIPAPSGRDAPAPDGPVLVPLSAKQKDALVQRAKDIQGVAAASDGRLDRLAGTLAWRRDHFAERAAFVASDPAELGAALARFAANPSGEIPGVTAGRARPLGRTAFVFPGQGSQWVGMGRELYARHGVFATVIDRCAKALAPHVDWDLTEAISAVDGELLSRIEVLQPALWAMSVGLAELWRAAGIEPDVVVGQSQGEIAAATVAGILSYEDAALVVSRRSAILRQMSGRGLMLAVELGAAGVQAALAGFEETVSLAAINGPASCLLSGERESVLVLKELLEVDGTFCRLVNVDYASHSPQMDEIAEEVRAALAPVKPGDGRTALMSTVTAAPVTGPDMGPAYWVDNLRRPVRFAEAMERLFDDGVTHVIEISAHPVVAPAIEQLAADRAQPPAVLSTLRRDSGSPRDLRMAFARAYVAGLEPFGELPEDALVPLPGYPWQRRRFWFPQGRRRTEPGGRLDVSLTPDPAEQDVWQYTLELDLDDQPWLSDHRVHDAVVLPGAAMMEFALRAAHARTGRVPPALADVRFRRSLPLTAEPTRLNVRWRDEAAGQGGFSLKSLPSGGTTWTEHATARVLGGVLNAGSAEFPDALLRTEPRDVAAFTRQCAARGLGYGPTFRGLRRLHVDRDIALGEILLNDRCQAGTRPHGLHPTLWDGALQVCLALCEGADAVVPVAARRVLMHQEIAEPVRTVWSHAVRRAGGMTFDLYLFDTDRRPLMTVEGLRLETIADVRPSPPDADRLHRLSFREVARPAARETFGPWVVCGKPEDGARDLRAALADAGVSVTLVSARDIGELPAAAGAVFVAPRSSAGLQAQRRGLLALTAVARACVSHHSPPRLAVVTANAMDVGAEDRPDPGAALYWGYSRVLRRELGELQSVVVDVAPDEDAWAARCAAELLAGDGEDQVVLRGERRFAGRLVRGALAADTDQVRPPWAVPVQPFRLAPRDEPMFTPLRGGAPAAGEIQLEVSAAGLGGDAAVRECAGRVRATGPDVTEFSVGDRVVAVTDGTLASHVTIRADHARPVPDGMGDAAAATLPMAMTTAWYGLRDVARTAAGETVLISAAGDLGIAAVRVARLLGARVLATADGEDAHRELRALGVEHVFSAREMAAADVCAVTGGRGVDVVLNSLAGSLPSWGLDVLAEGGRFVELASRERAERRVDLTAPGKDVTLSTVDPAGLVRRRPERFGELFAGVWDLVRTGRLAPLPFSSFPFAEVAEALREASRGDGKVVLTDPGSVRSITPEPMVDGRFRDDATYLVTGGLGALGLSLAEFLVDRGAGAVALMSRSAPQEEAARRIQAMRSRGAQVETFAVDVADPAALRRVMGELRAGMPPLRGVVHAAGLLDDATIMNLRPDQLERVLAPKVDGVRNLDELTSGDSLDLFVMFSSAAALVGNAGQAAYAAANAFMDGFAVARRRQGLPALSVQWGPFAAIGLAADDANRGARLAARGMTGFTADEAWQALAHFLATDEQVLAYVPLNLRQWFDAYPDAAAQPSWELLRETSARNGADCVPAAMRLAPDKIKHDVVEARIREHAGRVLRLDPEAIESDAPFTSLGLDSLMGLELRNRLEAGFGLKLSPTLLWTYGNPRALAGLLCDRLRSAAAT